MYSEIIHHIIISKYTLECTQLNYLLKIFLEEHTLESSINKIEQRYTHSTINNARGMYYNTTPLAKKLHPLFGHRFLPLKMTIHSGTPPPSNDSVCDHNAMSAFPQEKNSHYTTGDVTPASWLLLMKTSVYYIVESRIYLSCLILNFDVQVDK